MVINNTKVIFLKNVLGNLLTDFCELRNIKTVAVRPFVRIRSVNQESRHAKLNGFGDLLKGSHQYDIKAIGHYLLAEVFFRGSLRSVSTCVFGMNIK